MLIFLTNVANIQYRYVSFCLETTRSLSIAEIIKQLNILYINE